MRLVVLAGSDSVSIRHHVEALLNLPGAELAGILVDEAYPSRKQRFKNLWRNSQREGGAYFITRFAEMVLEKLDEFASRVVDAREVDALLYRAFPDEAFSLEALAVRNNIPFARVWNLNSPAAAEQLRAFDPDLGIVMGTRILKRSTFGVPRMGSINVHKGKVPEFRGMPPAFWELFEGVRTCGVTIHFVNDGLDTGDIVKEGEIPIHPMDRPDTLRHRLNELSARLLRSAVEDLCHGVAVPHPQPPSTHRTRTRPTRKQLVELSNRAPHLAPVRPRAMQQLIKTAVYLLFAAVQLPSIRRRLRRESRAAILLYHRVDDFSADPLTTSRRRFAEHLCFLRRHYEVRSTSWLLERLRSREPISPRTVLIHFDDCYESVATAAAPLLTAAGLPAAAFVSSGFIGTDRKFEHDACKFPLDYPNLTAEQVRRFAEQGIETGSHTVNHVDMGTATPEEARYELFQSRKDLEALLGQDVLLFSFPYGRPEHFSRAYTDMARECGYQAIFSAHGGFVKRGGDLLDIPRFGVAESHRPLDLMMDLEGLGLGTARVLLGAPNPNQ